MTLLSFVCILSILTQKVILNSSATQTETEIGHEKSERSLDLFPQWNPVSVYTSKVHKRFLMVKKKIEKVNEEIQQQNSKLKSQETTLNNFSEWTKEELRGIKEMLSKVRESVKEVKIELIHAIENQTGFVEETSTNFHGVQRALAGANDKIQELELSTTELNKTQVPIGFVYVQMAGQQELKLIWPNYTWEEISEEYAGLFFRAVGGTSAAFGQVQNETCPRILQIRSEQNERVGAKDIKLFAGDWSKFLETGRGQSTASSTVKTQFLTSNDEVTPRNQAMKIWRRIE